MRDRTLLRARRTWADQLLREQATEILEKRTPPKKAAQHPNEEVRSLDAYSTLLKAYLFNVFATFTIRNRTAECARGVAHLRGPHPERILKAMSAYVAKLQLEIYGPFPLAGGSIVYFIAVERGDCPCGERRWHAHGLLKLPGHVTRKDLRRFQNWWSVVFGWCKLSFIEKDERARRYLCYASKKGEVEIRTSYADYLDYQKRGVTSFMHWHPERNCFVHDKRAMPCPRCGLVSLCKCEPINPDQLELFAANLQTPAPARSEGRGDSVDKKTVTVPIVHGESAPSEERSRRADADREMFLAALTPRRAKRRARGHSRNRPFVRCLSDSRQVPEQTR
jgi:hypothetical protein